MPPLLHPRSTATSTLFAGTLLASFIVVAIPHVLPCPRTRRAAYQDSEVVFDADGKPIRRTRKALLRSAAMKDESRKQLADDPSIPTPRGAAQTPNHSSGDLDDEVELFRSLKEEAEARSETEKNRECPVPKPKTVLQKLIGNS